MTAARRLMEQAEARGVRVFWRDGAVRVAYRGDPPRDLLAELRAAKREIEQELTQPGLERLRPLLFNPEQLQREADRRNFEAIRTGSTDRWCACRRMASYAWPDGEGREIWRCLDCGPVGGQA